MGKKYTRNYWDINKIVFLVRVVDKRLFTMKLRHAN